MTRFHTKEYVEFLKRLVGPLRHSCIGMHGMADARRHITTETNLFFARKIVEGLCLFRFDWATPSESSLQHIYSVAFALPWFVCVMLFHLSVTPETQHQKQFSDSLSRFNVGDDWYAFASTDAKTATGLHTPRAFWALFL